jgi:hypothetical protein
MKKFILGQEVLCPDGIGRIEDIDPNGYYVRIQTYFKNRSCNWDIKNVQPWPIEENVAIIDIEKEFWKQIKTAAKNSEWIPEDYYMNDWVSDVCNFLKLRRY